MKKVTGIAHELLCMVEQKKVAIDFTCGNGYDTFSLAHSFARVYAFDIQEEAIENTKNHCRYLRNIEYVLDSHEHFTKYVTYYDAGIFNLGYLPHGNPNITTNYDTVRKTLKYALLYLRSGGKLVIVLYPGFAAGCYEAEKLEPYFMELESSDYDVQKIQMLNRHQAPYIIQIDKH